MGSDYTARKAAKRKRKRHNDGAVDAEELDGTAVDDSASGHKRERRKRPKVRRFCRGMCYSDPESSASGGGEGRENEQVGVDEAKTNKARRRRKDDGLLPEGGRGVKLSTNVGLSEFTPRQKASEGAAVGGPGFEALLPPPVAAFLRGEGFNTPTPVQEKCWPILAEGNDAQVLAPTGSGKTLGFLVPLVLRLQMKGLLGLDPLPGPLALVLAPTREVAQQTARAARGMRSFLKLRTVTLFGGAPKKEQAALLAKSPHLLVASPGRLLDMVEEGLVSLGNVSYVALDEADKLLSLGFEAQLEAIRKAVGASDEVKKPVRPLVLAPNRLSKLGEGTRPRPQVCLFTATMPEAVEEAAAKWLHHPKRVCIRSDTGAAISPSITQVVQICAEHKKPRKLLRHVQEIYSSATGRNPPRVLVFANRVKTVRFVYKLLKDSNMRVAMLHGERSQQEREEAMIAFRSGKASILVATDVAGRGLHIRGLPYIVNYDFPSNLDSYVHRVGRTGRLAANGHAFSFFTRSLARLAPAVLKLLRASGGAVDPNLVILAEAWEEAVRQDPELANVAVPDDDEEEEEEEDMQVEDDIDQDQAAAEGHDEAVDKNSKAGRSRQSNSSPHETAGKDKQISGKKRKSLPGRLRKKLAKEKAAKGK